MVALTTGQLYVDAPVTKPRPLGLFDAATLKPFSDPHEQMGVIFEQEIGAPGRLIDLNAVTCISTAAETIEGFQYGHGLPFYIYAGVQCNLFQSGDGWEAEAKVRLERGQQRLVESNLWLNILPTQAINLTPSGAAAVPLEEGVAILETYAGLNYDGNPILHVPRKTAVRLRTHHIWRDNLLPAGEEIVNGGGYVGSLGPVATALVDGDDNVTIGQPISAFPQQSWIYMTGSIDLRHNEMTTFEAIDRPTNTRIGIAQQTFVPTIDSFVAAVRVNLES
jgi:hypothetical protein